jgi:hypothetical protein
MTIFNLPPNSSPSCAEHKPFHPNQHTMKSLKNVFPFVLLLMLVACEEEGEVEKMIPCIPSGLSEHVLAFYPFSNGSLDDISGDNHNLSNTTTARSTTDRAGNADCAYEFVNLPTSSEFLTTTQTAFLNGLDEFSISLWYQPKDSSNNLGRYESLVNRDLGLSCPDRNGQWSLGLYDCRKAVFGRTNSVWDKNLVISDCEEEFLNRTGQWFHVVATFKQDGVEMKLYRNRTLQETSTGAAACSSGTPTYQDMGDLFVGKDFTGKIDDVILFKKALSQQDVDALYAMDACCE